MIGDSYADEGTCTSANNSADNIRRSDVSTLILFINRVVIAVRIQVRVNRISYRQLNNGCIIGVYKSTYIRIIISTLEIIQANVIVIVFVSENV